MRRAKALAAGLALAALAGGCVGGGEEGDGDGDEQIETVAADPKFGEQPNFVFVLTDDQNAAQYTRQTMPKAFDLFAGNGTTFESHIATTPLCCPSRASMLTGQYGHNNGILNNVPGWGSLVQPENILPVWLQRVGYRTGYVGKWLNGYKKTVENEEEVPAGWDEWFSLVGAHGYYRYKASDNGKKTGARKTYLTQTLNKHAVAMVRQLSGEDPFFVQLSHLAPHGESPRFLSPGRCTGNAVPAPRDSRRFRDAGLPDSPSINERDISDKPGFLRRRSLITPPRLEFFERRYECRLASLPAVDRGIGQLVRALAAEDELKDTVFVFGSDNGVFHAEHRMPGGKGLPYDEALQIPFAIRAPERYRGGQPAPPSVDLPTANIDVVPTIVDLAGAPTCSEDDCRVMDGRSLVPLLSGREDAWPSSRPLVAEYDNGAPTVKPGRATSCSYSGVMLEQWLYVRHSAVPDAQGTCIDKEVIEQYDSRRDPFQLDNLAAVKAAQTEDSLTAAGELERLLDELQDCAGIRGRDPEPASGHYCG